jgi:hypothetical protein
MSTRLVPAIAALGLLFLRATSFAQSCAQGNPPTSLFPFFGNTDPNLGVSSATVTIYPNEDGAADGDLETAVSLAASAWSQSCPQSTYPDIPTFDVNWDGKAPTGPNSSHVALVIEFLPDTVMPLISSTPLAYASAQWVGGGSQNNNSPTVIDVYGLCPPGVTTFNGGCTSGVVNVPWNTLYGQVVLEHEIGHALGLNHDRATDGSGNACSTNGVMATAPNANAFILTGYCYLANRENDDMDACNNGRQPTPTQTNPCESDPPAVNLHGGPGSLGIGSGGGFCRAYAWICPVSSGPANPWSGSGIVCNWACSTTTDASGNVISAGCTWACFAADVEVNTDVAGPLLSVTSPAPGQTVAGVIGISGWAMQYFVPGSISLGVDGNQVAVGSLLTGLSSPAACEAPSGVVHSLCNANSGFSGTFDTRTLANGAHTLDAVAGNSFGWVTSIEVPIVTANTCFDMVPPTVSVLAPSTGASVSGAISVTAAAADNVSVSQVALYVDGQIKSVLTSAPWTWSWDTSSYAPGNHTLYMVATDSCSNSTGSKTVTVKVLPTPRMFVDQPTGGATVSGSSVSLVGWATDAAGIAYLTFSVDGGSLPADAPYTYGLNRSDVCAVYPGDPACPHVGWGVTFDSTKLTNGGHTLTITATDHQGLSVSFTLGLVVSNAPPPVVTMAWMEPEALAGYGPVGSLVVAGDASGAPAGTGVQLWWRDVTSGGPWTEVGYAPAPSSGVWVNSIPSVNTAHQYAAYAEYGGVASSACTYPGSNNVYWCP